MDFDKIANSMGSGSMGPMKPHEFKGVIQGYTVDWKKATIMERLASTSLGKWFGLRNSLVQQYSGVVTDCLVEEYRMVHPNRAALCEPEVLWAAFEQKLTEVCGEKIKALESITEKDRNTVMGVVDKLVSSVRVSEETKQVTSQLDKVISNFKVSKELQTAAKMKVDLYAVAYDYLKDHLDPKSFDALLDASTPKRVANQELFERFCKDTENGVDDVEEKVLRKWFRGHLIVGLDELGKDQLIEVLIRMRGQ